MSPTSELAVSKSSAMPHLEGIPLAPAAPAPRLDCSPEEVAERRYLAVLNPLLQEAWEQRQLETLVDCLAWTLARVVVGLDNTLVTGDLLRRLGNYTYRLTESKRAEAEAEAAKKEGRAPN